MGRSLKEPKFLLIRFAPGAAGRFLATALMGSRDVAHFDPNAITPEDKLNYVKTCFTENIDEWLRNEPSDKLAWGITFVSNKYPRGHNLSRKEFLELAEEQCTDWYHHCVEHEKRIIIPWNKIDIPEFYKGEVISIYLDKKSLRWFYKAHWLKHYGIKDGMIHLKENDPKYHRTQLANIVSQFNNPIFIESTNWKSFVRNNVMHSEINLKFSNVELLEKTAFNNITIPLSSLLEERDFMPMIDTICEKFSLEMIDQEYRLDVYRHWRNCHDF